MPDVSIVVPVYNEEESLPHLLEALVEARNALGRTCELVLVDDGSTDGTWPLLKKATEDLPDVHCIQFRRNFGQTAAMSAGFEAAEGDIIVTLDADMQNDPADVPKLLSYMDEGYDVVSGWRKNRQDDFLTRLLPSRIANGLISRITGVHLHDYGCTLKAYRREVIQNTRLYGEMHRFIPALASWVGGRITEVEVNHRAREFGQSKYGLSRTFRVVLDLITVKFLLRYSMGPIQLFGKLGGLVLLPGLLLFGLMVLAHVSFLLFGTQLGAELIKRPFWLATSLLMIFLGVQLVSMGLLAELQIRTYHEAQGKRTYHIREDIRSSDL